MLEKIKAISIEQLSQCKFHYATLCVLNLNLLSQNLFTKSYLYRNLSRKKLWGSGRPPSPPLNQEGLIR